MRLREIQSLMNEWASAGFAENYDNVGAIVGELDTEIHGILVNLDVNEAVLEEAIQKKCNLIVTHHPIWFNARKKLNGEDFVSRILLKAIRKNIALFAIHTNLDNVSHGVNQKICQKLSLQNCRFLQPKAENDFEVGSGMLGELKNPVPKYEFLKQVQEIFHPPVIRYADCSKEMIHKVAVCGGAGSFLIDAALKANADILLTSDITYHKFFENENQLILADIGHYESEQFTSELIVDFLNEKFPNFAVYLSEIYTNPIRYFF